MESLIKLDTTSLTEEAITQKAQVIIESIENGNTDALKAFIIAKAYEELSKKVAQGAREYAIDEALTYTPKDSNIFGVNFQVRNGSDQYDYDKDDEYRFLKEACKARQKLLKDSIDADKKGSKVIHEGEIIPVVPLKKHGAQQLAISFKYKSS